MRIANLFKSIKPWIVVILLSLPLGAIAGSIVEQHGQLSVKGKHIVNDSGEAVSLSGPSFFWSNSGWGAERYYNAKVVRYLKTDWNATLIRAAIGVEGPGGYIEDPTSNLRRAKALIDAAIDEGLYIIVDWHSHHAEAHPEKAIAFFAQIATLYGDKPNIIYEIYNEPLRKTRWKKTIKPYAEQVISVIREIDPDNIIVVGTQTWSQDVDKAAKSPLKNQHNIAYTLHFYAGTHKQSLRDKAEYAMNKGLALMVTEWGTVNADGDGSIDKASVEEWLAFMKKHKLSHCNWSLHDKKEGASILESGTLPNGQWTDDNLTETGLYVKSIIKNW